MKQTLTDYEKQKIDYKIQSKINARTDDLFEWAVAFIVAVGIICLIYFLI